MERCRKGMGLQRPRIELCERRIFHDDHIRTDSHK
jgi:hypothetical protein